ncbi:hypothetical protein Mame01_61970 [Microbispora amethystogenes]|nr:hypothetical protein Mame01_61970 [Microbispora amethystogenes]
MPPTVVGVVAITATAATAPSTIAGPATARDIRLIVGRVISAAPRRVGMCRCVRAKRGTGYGDGTGTVTPL